MNHRLVLTVTTVLGIGQALGLAANTASPQTSDLQSAANKAVALMEKSMAALTPNVPCASCHHNMIPLWALSVARDHGVTVNAKLYKQVAVRTYSYLNDVDRAIQGTQYVDPALEGAEQLAFANEAGVKNGFSTALHTARLARLQKADGRWVTFDARPPQSFSLFMTTALGAKSLGALTAPELKADAAKRIEKAREYLLRNQPFSTEDATYRLLGLYWTGATPKQLQAAAKVLMSMQRPQDGAWTQVPGRGEPDAYATGEALVALQLTGTSKTEAINRGLAYLLRTQAEDGSWHVKTRLHEVAPISPPYMETGFPYGKDQIISMYGTTFAMMALSLALPMQKGPVEDLAEIHQRAEDWMYTAAFGSMKDVQAIDVKAASVKGSTPLMAALNDPARVSALLANGADVKARAKSGHTPLSVAATWNGSAHVMQMLITRGASAVPVKGVEFNANPLVYTAFNDDLEATKILLDAGASYKQGMLLQGVVPMSPLTAAVYTDSANVLTEFLRRGADPNTVEDIPLLSWAAASNRAGVTKVLLQAGADPEAKDKYQWTPVQHARGVDHDRPAVEALLRPAIEAKNQQQVSKNSAQR